MLAVLRWSCAVSMAVLCATAPVRVQGRVAEPEPPTEPTDAEADPDAAVEAVAPESTSDSIHDAMVQAFTDHFQQGQLQYNRGNYVSAAAEFEQAFAAIPAEAALRNVVLSHERAGDHVAAAIAARRYLALPACGGGVDVALCGSHTPELEATLERLLGRVAELRLDVAAGVPLREVRINGRPTPLDDFPILVAAGRVDIELTGQLASQRRQRVIEVRAGEVQTVIVDGFEISPRPPIERRPPTGSSAPAPGGKWLRPAFWGGVGATSVSLVAVATLGGLTIQAGREFERLQDEFNDNRPVPEPGGEPIEAYPHDAERRYGTMRVATNVMVGVSAGLATLTLIVGAVALSRPRNAGTTRASTQIRWRFDGAGITVRY